MVKFDEHASNTLLCLTSPRFTHYELELKATSLLNAKYYLVHNGQLRWQKIIIISSTRHVFPHAYRALMRDLDWDVVGTFPGIPDDYSAYAKKRDFITRARPKPLWGVNRRLGTRHFFFPAPKYCPKLISTGLNNYRSVKKIPGNGHLRRRQGAGHIISGKPFSRHMIYLLSNPNLPTVLF